jgi:tRNA1(Val) A37 N6-methylase TrmN6
MRIECPLRVSPPGKDSYLLAKTAERLAPRRARILDMGCGTGFVALSLAAAGWKNVSGCDIDPLAVETARKNAASDGLDTEFFVSDLFSAVRQKPDLVLFNPPSLGGPAGFLSLTRRSKLLSRIILSFLFTDLFERRILARFLRQLPAPALVVLYRKAAVPGGKLVANDGDFNVWAVGPPKKA